MYRCVNGQCCSVFDGFRHVRWGPPVKLPERFQGRLDAGLLAGQFARFGVALFRVWFHRVQTSHTADHRQGKYSPNPFVVPRFIGA